MTEPLESDEVVFLRPPVEADRGEFLSLRRESGPQAERWEPRPPDGFDRYGDEAWEKFLTQASTPTSVRLLAVRRGDHAIVGQVSISQIYRGPFCNGIMGWWCGTRYWNLGYMTRAVRVAIRYAFDDLSRGLGLHRLEANIRPENAASLAVARKVGLRHEGYSPRYLQIDGKFRDHARFAMVREDWEFVCGEQKHKART